MFDLGMRLQQLRVNQKMSQKQLGKKLNRSSSVISAYENNVRIPPFDVLAEIATIFNVSVDSLMGLEKEEMASLAGLNETQKDLVYSLITELKKGFTAGSGLTVKEQDVLNRTLVEFNKLHK